MPFFHPIWRHEGQRLGKKLCTPTGYALHVMAEVVGLAGALMLFVVPGLLIRRAIGGTFRPANLWALAAPLVVGVVGEAMFQLSWWLARRKGFRYDDDRCEASWVERGEPQTYRWPG